MQSFVLVFAFLFFSLPGFADFDLQDLNKREIPLSGEWHFIEGLVSPKELLDAKVLAAATKVEVPGSVKFLPEASNLGVGTFFIKLDNLPQGIFGLRARVDSSFRALIAPTANLNDITEIMQVGKVGSSPETSIPANSDSLGRFEINKTGSYYLLIQASNFHFGNFGIWGSPRLGDYGLMQTNWFSQLIQEAMLFGIVLILAIYNFSLYFYRREDPANLYLALYSLAALIRFLGTNALLSPLLLGSPTVLNHHLMRIFEFGFVGTAPSFLLGFVLHNYAKEAVKFRASFKWYLAATCTFTLVILVMSPLHYRATIPLLNSMIVVGIIAIIYFIGKAAWQKKKSSYLMCGGILLLATAVIADVAMALNFLKLNFYLSPYGAALFIFFLGQVVAQLFSSAFRKAEVLSQNLQEEVDKKTIHIQSLLDNIPQGICSIEKNFMISKNYSIHLEKVLESSNLIGKSIIDMLFKNTDLNIDQCNRLENALAVSIGESELNYELNQANFPSEGIFSIESQKKYVQYIWSPICNKQGIISQMMLIIRDVTAIKEADQEKVNQRKELEYIIEIVNVTPEKFDSFINSSKLFLAENSRLIRLNKEKDIEVVKILFINMHTIKGAARTLGLNKMTAVLHEVEQFYADLLRIPDKIWSPLSLLDDLSRIESVFINYVSINMSKLGRSAKKIGEVTVERNVMEEQNRALRAIDFQSLNSKDAGLLNHTIDLLESICYSNSTDVFEEILSSSSRLARDLGKETPIIRISPSSIKFSDQARHFLTDTFIHIVRNTVDHGLETASERVAKGKSPTGSIFVKLSETPFFLVIEYSDDGRGLNLAKLAEKGQASHALGSDHNRQDIANLVFSPGLSTAPMVTDISGRGVGMDAVKRFIEEQKGRVEIVLLQDWGHFCPFILKIYLPKNLYITARKGEALSA